MEAALDMVFSERKLYRAGRGDSTGPRTTGSRKRLKDDNRPIGSRHNGLGNGDQLILLAEHAQPRRLRRARVQFSDRSGNGFGTAHADLAERNIEFRTVAHALFDNRQHIHAREIRQQMLERNDALVKLAGAARVRQFLERNGLFDGKFTDGGTFDFREVRATAKLLAHFVRQRTDVGARRTLDHEASKGAFQVRQTIFKEFDVHGFQLDGLFLAGQLVSGPAVNFFGGKYGRHLLEASNTLGGKPLEHARIESGAGVRALRFAIGVVRVGGEAEAEARGVALSPAGIEARKPRRAPEEQNQDSCREGIERAEMADLAEASEMPDGIDHVVRRLALGLVDDQSAIEGRGLRLARHEF